MMGDKLTAQMKHHLASLDYQSERGAYPDLSLGTLNALERRGLVVSRHTLGSMAFPHTSIRWRLTEAGRTAVASPSSNGER